MVEENDFDLFDKIQTEVVKKVFDVSFALEFFYIWKIMIIMQMFTHKLEKIRD